MQETILKLSNITKVYDNGVIANRNIDLDVNQGEIHAIVGENGAGKSTLMKIIFGLEQPTSGDIYINGTKTKINDVNHAIQLGIGMVHQHFMLVPSFSVVQNIMLGIEPKKGLSVDLTECKRKVKEIADKYQFNLNLDDIVQDISVGMKQKVEILKALIRGAKILILDEPTAVLTPQETEELFVQLEVLKKEGHTILFISHKLKEVKAISDRVTVIQRGETKGVFETDKISVQEISKKMVGRDVILSYQKSPSKAIEVGLKVQNLTVKPSEHSHGLKDLNFTVKKGMILGIAGVEGNGQTELINVLTSKNKAYQGTVALNNQDIKGKDIRKLRDDGLSYIPEDRMHLGIAPDASIEDNILSNRCGDKEYNKGILLNQSAIVKEGKEIIDEYQIVCKNGKQIVEHLSGGNIQKVVVGRECSIEPEILIAEQPTRGVDLGAAEIIHKKLIEMRDNNVAILMVSADLNEVVEVSDAFVVLFDGEIVAYIDEPSKITEQELGEYMLGIKRQSEEEIRRAYHE